MNSAPWRPLRPWREAHALDHLIIPRAKAATAAKECQVN
jgi:hypothetical protein